MSNANTATAFRRTEAGADELTQPKLGLSVPQRKMLRCCGTATSLNDIERLFAAEEAHYSRERFDRDLEKLEQFGLIQRTGAALKIVHTKPSAATIALPPQIKPAAQRGPELRTVSTAQPQPQRIVHALIGAGVIALAGTLFWLTSGPAPEQLQPASVLATATEPANHHSDPVFIDEPPTEPATTGKPAATAKPAKPGDGQRSVKAPAAPASGNRKANQPAAPQPAPAAAIAAPASLQQPVAAEPQRNTRPPETAAVTAESQSARPAATLNMATSIKPPSLPVAVQPPVATPVAPVAATPAPVAVAAVRAAEPSPVLPREPEAATKVEKKPVASGLRLAHREKAEFPPEALLSDIRKGTVRARLAIDESGNVTDVTIVGAQGGRLFSRPAIAALKKWRYEPTGQRETTVAEIEFRE